MKAGIFRVLKEIQYLVIIFNVFQKSYVKKLWMYLHIQFLVRRYENAPLASKKLPHLQARTNNISTDLMCAY